jgi:hypothetical protein
LLRSLSFLAIAVGLACSGPAFAADGGDFERTLGQLSEDSAHQAVIRDALSKARAALKRAQELDLAADGKHASMMMRAVAREWVQVARDLVRAADAEQRATESERRRTELETKTVRGRALLEETVARRGRAKALLQQLEEEQEQAGKADAAKKTPKAKAAPKKDAPKSAPKPPLVNE